MISPVSFRKGFRVSGLQAINQISFKPKHGRLPGSFDLYVHRALLRAEFAGGSLMKPTTTPVKKHPVHNGAWYFLK
jgi:hypothetical protein